MHGKGFLKGVILWEGSVCGWDLDFKEWTDEQGINKSKMLGGF